MIKVTHYHRKVKLGAYSVERLFTDIRSFMPPDIKITVQESTFVSRGFFRRFYNIVEAAFRQGNINHVTGEVYFLTYLLNRHRTILTILDCGGLERLSGIKKWVLWLLWYKLPVYFASVITVISTTTKQELLKHVNCDPDKIQVIYACVSTSFCPDVRPFNGDYPRVLQIGTGSHNKNLTRVAQALAGIPCRWIIIGTLSVEQLAVIKSYSIDYENYAYLSEEALLVQYQQADMLVFASTYEGFGLPIVEANAVGRPVVTSNLYSMPEVAGDAACLVDPFNVISIREGILKIITDAEYRENLVTSGFTNVRRFHPTVIAAQYAQLYRQLYADSSL